MKYTTELTIRLPRERVVALFDDPANLAKWQKGLKSMEPLSGTPGTEGAKTRLVYDEGGREMVLVETLLTYDLPDAYVALYEARGVKNRSTNRFYATEDNQTRWVQENEFKFSGLMAVAALFMRGAFPKQTRKDMGRFKNFAEYADR